MSGVPMVAQPVNKPELPTVPPDKPKPTSLAPIPNSPAKTAGGTRGDESPSENTKVSDSETLILNPVFKSVFGKEVSNSSKLNPEDLADLEKMANKNTRSQRGAGTRPRANSISGADTLESIKKTQKLQYRELSGGLNTIIDVVNSISKGLYEWCTDLTGQVKDLKEELKLNQGGQLLSQKALREELERTNSTLNHLVNSEVSLSDTKGLQDDIKAMRDDISKAVQTEAENNAKGLRAIGDEIVTAMEKSKGDAEMSSPDNKKRKTSLRQIPATPASSDPVNLGSEQIPMEVTPPTPTPKPKKLMTPGMEREALLQAQKEAQRKADLAVVHNQMGNQNTQTHTSTQGLNNNEEQPQPNENLQRHRADSNTNTPKPQGQQNGQRRNKQSYAGVAGNGQVGAPPHDPNYNHRSNNKARFTQQEDRNQSRDSDWDQNRNPQNANNGNKYGPKLVRDVYHTIEGDIETGNIKRVDGFKEVPYKSETGKKKEERRHKDNLEEVKVEFILFNIPTKKDGIRALKQSDNARVIKILKELRSGGFILKNGDVTGTTRQQKNERHLDFIPITVSTRTPEITTKILEAAVIGQLANFRAPKAGDAENDRIGYLRRSLTHRERQSIKNKAEWRRSARGRAHIEIKKRVEESTTSQEEWENMDLGLEEDIIIDQTPNATTTERQQTDTNTGGPQNGEAELAQAREDLEKMRAQLAIGEAKWRLDQEAQNGAREDEIERQLQADNAERDRKLALNETDNDVFHNASSIPAREC